MRKIMSGLRNDALRASLKKTETECTDGLAGLTSKPFLIRQQEIAMNRLTFVLTLCMVGVWAPTHAQSVDTSVVRLPQDIIYNGSPGSPST